MGVMVYQGASAKAWPHRYLRGEKTMTKKAERSVAFSARSLEGAALERNCPLPEKGQVTYYDRGAAMPRGATFGVRCSHAGARSYVLIYRVRGQGGRVRRATIGQVGEPIIGKDGRAATLTLATAREKALRIAAAAREGRDLPAQEVEARAKRERDPDTVTLIRDYLEATEGRWSAKTGRECRRCLDTYIADDPIAKLKAGEVRHDDVRRLVEGVAEAAGRDTANRVLGMVRQAFENAVDSEVISRAPAGMRKLAVKVERDTTWRALLDATKTATDPEKIKAVWVGVESCGPVVAAFTRFLLLTGLRLKEAVHLRSEHLDPKANTISIPAELRKGQRGTRRGLVLPLSPLAVEVLHTIPDLGSPWIFPSVTKPSAPLGGASNFGRVIDSVKAATGVRFSFHGLRGTLATGLGELGVPRHTISTVLGHSHIGGAPVTGVYDRADRVPEVGAALRTWAIHVDGVVTGRVAKVLLMRRGGGE